MTPPFLTEHLGEFQDAEVRHTGGGMDVEKYGIKSSVVAMQSGDTEQADGYLSLEFKV